jgi:PKD repeat protein
MKIHRSLSFVLYSRLALTIALALCSGGLAAQQIISYCIGSPCNSVSNATFCGNWQCHITVCPGQDITLFYQKGIFGGPPIQPSSIQWEVDNDGNVISASNPRTFNWSEPGNHVVSFGLLPGQATAYITVVPDVMPQPEINAPKYMCEGATITFPCDLGSPTAASSCVDWGDGSAPECVDGNICAAGNVQHTYAQAGTYTVSLSSTGCTGAQVVETMQIVVQPLPVVTITGPAFVCPGQTVTYTAPAGLSNYDWQVVAPGSFITGSGNSVNVTFGSTSGAVTLSATNGLGCSNDAVKSVTVKTVQPSFTVPTPVCRGQSVCLTNTSTYTGPAPTWSWNFSPNATPSTSTMPAPCVTFNSVGNATITLTANNGCPSPAASQTITVNAVPSVSLPPVQSVCQNNSVTITPIVTPGCTCNWTVVRPNSTVATSSGPSLTFTALLAGTYNITVQCGNAAGCRRSASTQVNVTARKKVGIKTIPPLCETDPSFTPAVTPSGGYWLSNIQGFNGTIVPTTVGDGTYTITYCVNNLTPCPASCTSQTFTITPAPCSHMAEEPTSPTRTMMDDKAIVVPNPTNGQFSIFTDALRAGQSIEIHAPDGRLVRSLQSASDQRIDLDLTQEPVGLYSVRISYEDHYEVVRIMKE